MYSQHELSAKFPRMPVEAFEALVEDIKTKGLRHPIILYEGKVLDGWHRERACIVAKVTPQYVKYVGGNPVAMILSENLHRRHLEPGQRALIVVECNQWRKSGVTGSSGDEAPGRTNKELAVEADTSTATIERAKVVSQAGSEVVKDKVRSGEVNVTAAAAVAATVPKRQQAKALQAPKPTPEPKAQKPKQEKPTKPATVLQSKYDELVAQYNELRENRDDLAAELEGCESLRADEHVVQIKQLQEQLRACARSRDEAMTRAVDLRKQLQWWKKQAEKLGWKPKDAKA